MRASKVALIAAGVSCFAPCWATAATTPFELSRAGSFVALAPGAQFSSFLSVGRKLYGSPMTLETHPGTITCSGFNYAGLTGTVQTNNLPTDTVQMESAFGIIDGTEKCSSTSALGATALVHLEPRKAILSLSGVEGKAELDAASASEPILIETAYSGGATCVYSAQALTGALRLEPSGRFEELGYKQLNIEFENQKVEPAGGSSPECPGDVTVTTPLGFQGQFAEGGSVYYIWGRILRPTITTLTPVKGSAAGGTAVAITGTNFTEVSAVHFGSLAAGGYTVNSTTSIMAISPPEPVGKVGVTVTGPGGTSAPKTYKYVPAVSSLTPNSGPAAGGTSVSVTGAGFVPGATAFKFGSTPAESVECTSSTFCTVLSPAHAAGKLNVTAIVDAIPSPKGTQNRYTYF